MAENLILFRVFILIVTFWGLQIAYERQVNRWNRHFEHKAALRKACSAGDSSFEWHAMRCTICGNFHLGDDGDCAND